MILSPKRILIVDDEEDLTWSISKSLMRESKFLHITCVNSGDEALKVFQKGPVDLVISDIRMPGIDGLELLSEIKQKYPSTKVIIMTAYGSSELRKEARKRGSLHYIEKPFEIHYLKKLVCDSLDDNGKKS